MTEQLPLHGIAVYNPGILSNEELKRYFVARRPLLEKLLAELEREQPGHAPQHRLIVGTRGMGKTTLLHRLALAVAEHPRLSTQWLPLIFPEEQYNIARLSDLWMNCLDALGDALEASGESTLPDEIDRCVDELPGEENERARTALQALMGFADRLDKRLLLLIDNLDIVLDRLEDAHWAIREVLGHEPRLLLIGASARVLEATYKYEAAFYDFFRIHELKGLGEEEMRELLRRLAEVDNNATIARLIEEQPARLRTLHTLTGGNPRTAVLLYGVLAQGIEGDVRSDLERLLDQCTPLYKARFEELSHQAQKVVDAMAIHWDPLTARQLAEQTRLPVNTVSTQLTRLERQGVVEKVALKPGRKSVYQIAERFFNIWYLMRTSRRVRRRLIWLVQFLKVFYSQEELKKRARDHLRQGKQVDAGKRLSHAEYGFSLARAVEDPVMRSALESSALQTMLEDSKLKKELAALIDFEDADDELKTRAERMAFMHELPDKVITARDRWPERIEAEVFASRLRESLSLSPEEKRRVVEALPGLSDFQIVELNRVFEDEKRRFSDIFLDHAGLLAALRQAVAEGHMVDATDADGARVAAQLLENELLSVYAKLESVNKADSTFTLDELHALCDSIEKLGLDYAWDNLGDALKQQGDIDGAIEAYRKQIEVKPDHPWAWNGLGIALAEQGDIDGAIKAYRKQIEIKPDHEHAWNGLGIALAEQGDIDGAIKAYRKQIEVKPDHEHAWYNLAIALKEQGDINGAIEAYRKQIEVKPDHEHAWNNLGNALKRQGDIDGAIEAYRRQVEIKPDHEHAWNNLGNALKRQGDIDGAIEAYRRQVENKPDHAWAWNGLGIALKQQGDIDGAIEAFRKQIEVKPDHAWAWNGLGDALKQQGDIDGAIAAYRKQIEVKPDHPWAWNGPGIALAEQGDIDGAIEAYRKQIEIKPNHQVAMNNLAWLYYEQQQNLDEAVALARKAVELDPKDLDARHTLATLLVSVGNWEEAWNHASAFLQQAETGWLESVWDDLLAFFREAVRHQRAAESARLIEETGNTEHLRPLHVALKAIAEGPDQLARVAPEVQQPAAALVKQLANGDASKQ